MVWLISRVSEVEKSHVFKSFMPNHKGGGVVKQTSQRSLLFRQNVNRTEAEWVADSAPKTAKLSKTIISRSDFFRTMITR